MGLHVDTTAHFSSVVSVCYHTPNLMVACGKKNWTQATTSWIFLANSR